MEKVKELVDLCKQRQQLFIPNRLGNSELFSPRLDDLTSQINRLAASLDIYSIQLFNEYEVSVAFSSLKSLQKVSGDAKLSVSYHAELDVNKYQIALFDGALSMHCFEKITEEHKKAQAM